MPSWSEIADRVVRGLGVRRGELIQIREHSGRPDVLVEMLLAIERAGATPLPELTPPGYLRRLLNEADDDYLAGWDRHRLAWMQQIHRVLVLQGAGLDADQVPHLALESWGRAVHRLTEVEEERRLPYMLVAVPTIERAAELSVPLEDLEAMLMPALAAPIPELRSEIDRVLARLQGSKQLVLRSANGAELRLDLGSRRWMADDGWIGAEDRLRGAHVSNLPSGAVFATVVETSSSGQLWLPEVMGSDELQVVFEEGCICGVQADGDGERRFNEMLGRHTGDCNRIGHIGIGLNPYLEDFVGWTLIDEHVHGAVFVSLGENRYLGGQNESSLNIDFALPNATLIVDEVLVVEDGRLLI
jgi:leucyl aminopeptidase (aminopeptidase T)